MSNTVHSNFSPNAKVLHGPPTTQQTRQDRPTLRWGSYGEDVRILQHLLNHAIVPSPGLAEDADFGDRTEIAVIGFQAGHQLVPDGIVGPLTWAALDPFHDGISKMFAAARAVSPVHSGGTSKPKPAPKPVPSLTGHAGAHVIRRAGKVVPHFWQGDHRWGGCSLGSSNMGCVGCAVTSMAMVLAYFGRDTDPGRLRSFLGGAACPLNWRVACGYPGGSGRLNMEWHEVAATRRKRIVDRLHKGLPSVVWVDYKNGAGGDHFVVIVGMAPNGHLIMNDPATPSGNGAMNWQDSGNRIETSRQHYKIVDLLCIDPV